MSRSTKEEKAPVLGINLVPLSFGSLQPLGFGRRLGTWKPAENEVCEVLLPPWAIVWHSMAKPISVWEPDGNCDQMPPLSSLSLFFSGDGAADKWQIAQAYHL